VNVITDVMHLTVDGASIVALGTFDGVHRGHQQLLGTVVERARELGLRAAVITFDPHPASVIAPERAPLTIATLEQRLEWFEVLGIDVVRVVTFDEATAHESAASFTQRVIVEDLHAAVVVTGDDTHFGRDREGDANFLESVGASAGFRVERCPSFGDGTRFSASLVRAALMRGALDEASAILGRPFVLRGTVVQGDHRGREIGYPTANLSLATRQALPALGIYAGAALVRGEWRCAAISVGRRPQFYDNGFVLVEVYLPDFSGDLYDTVLDVAFLSHLRPEATFPDLAGLLEQMGRDVQRATEIFASFTATPPFLLR
jgi:riboflavin kinase/FMN adenylyltransferase